MPERVNWAETVRHLVRRVVTVAPAPAGANVAARIGSFVQRLDQLAAVVRNAADEGRHVRAVGSSWSFTRVIESPDYVVETQGLSQLIEVTQLSGGAPVAGAVLWNELTPAAKAVPNAAYVYLEGGVVLADALAALDARGLSLVTAGSASGQTIAGVISTGSHGADFDQPPVADMVRAIVLLTPDGEVRWIEPDSRPLTNEEPAEAAVRRVLPSVRAAFVHRDDGLFDAALVSVGGLGVVCGYVIEVRKAYALSEKVTAMKWSAVRPILANGTAFGPNIPGTAHPAPANGPTRYRYLEVLVNPYRASDAYGSGASTDRDVLLVTRNEASAIPGTAWHRDGASIGVQIHTLLTIVAGSQPAFRKQVDAIMASSRHDSGGYRRAHDVMNTGRSSNVKVWSYEVAVSTAQGKHLAFVDALLARFDALHAQGKKLAGFFSLRHTKGTTAALGLSTGPAGPDGRTLHVEIFALQQPTVLVPPPALIDWDPTRLAADSEEYLAAVEDVVEEFGVGGFAKLHWGQYASTPDRFSVTPQRFPKRAVYHDAWRRLCSDQPHAFSNEWLLRAGACPLEAGWKLVGGALPTWSSTAPLDANAAAAAPPAYVAGPAANRAYLYASDANGWCSLGQFFASRPSTLTWGLVRKDFEGDPTPTRCVAGRISVVIDDDDKHVVVARMRDGQIAQRTARLSDPTRGYGFWEIFDGSARFASDPHAVRANDGIHHVFAVDNGGVLRRRWQGSWRSLPLPPGSTAVGRPSVVLRPDNRLEVYLRDSFGEVWATRQAAAGSANDFGAWAPTTVDGGMGDPVARHIAGGTLLAVPRAAGGCNVAFRGPGANDLFGVPVLTPTRPRIRAGTHPTIAALSAQRFVVAMTDEDGAVWLFPYRIGAGFEGAGTSFDALATSGPRLVVRSETQLVVLIKIAHDLVQARTVTP